MSGRTQTDRFQELLPTLKRSKMYKLPEFHQRGITIHTASGYGTNIMKWNTQKESKEVKSKVGVISRNLERMHLSRISANDRYQEVPDLTRDLYTE